MSVTQEDIAKELGVSREWVTRALSGSPRVSEASRRRVLECAQKMGYDEHTNREARMLTARRLGRRHKSGIIAVLVPHSQDGPAIATPFFGSLMTGMQAEAGIRNIDVYISAIPYGRELPRLIRDGGVDGVICTMGDGGAIDQQLRNSAVPIVSAMAWLGVGFHLTTASRDGTRLSVRHLVTLGHRRIGYIGFPPVNLSSIERLGGFYDGLRVAGIACDPELEETDMSSVEGAFEGVHALLERCPDLTAIVCTNDVMAIQAVRALQSRGLQVPEDVSVVGFDDISTELAFTPALTSIAFDRRAMGRRAVQIIAEHADAVSGKPLADIAQLTGLEEFPTTLVVRASTGVCKYRKR